MRGGQPIGAILLREFAHRSIRFDRQPISPGEVLKESDELVARVDTIRIRTLVAVAGHDGLHVGRIHTKGIPPLRAPGLSYATPL